jgi:two-component system sensor histidine kinase/response regulator
MKNDSSRKHILVVDDNPKNIQLVGSFLTREGYAVEFAASGREALEWLQSEPFDMVLLDVIMPEMNGFQVCAAIKKIEGCKEIPIIFLTAKHDLETFLEGFKVGGVDYIFKPFVMEELKVRVGTHLQIFQQRKELQNLNATRDKLLSIISHDLRTPLLSNVLLLERLVGKTSRFSAKELQELLASTLESARNSLSLLESMLVWAKAQTGQIVYEPVLVKPGEIMADVMATYEPLASVKGLKLKVAKSTTAKLRTDYYMLTTILRNLISNAVKFSCEKGSVTVSCSKENGNMTFTIGDNGIGMSKQRINQLFSNDQRTANKTNLLDAGSGLGLLICKDFVEKMGGTLSFKSTLNKGTTVEFVLPLGIKA